MSTSSAIGYILPDGKIKSVYCHNAGQPKPQIIILSEHYNSLKTVKKLISGGNISVLRTQAATFDTQIKYDENNILVKNEHGIVYEQNREPQPLYYKERGDDWDDIKPIIHDSLEDFISYLHDANCEHMYIYCQKNIKFSDFLKRNGIAEKDSLYAKVGRWFFQ